MNHDPEVSPESTIIESWNKNADPWTEAVRQKLIPSRRQVTDKAIIDAIISYSPNSVLDIGCGEGWLVRELRNKKIDAVGVDVVPALIAVAKQAGGDFHLASYSELAAGNFNLKADVAVSNFSLLGKESVEDVFHALPFLLNEHGVFIVQTLHPVMKCGDLPYEDGWREGSWNGFSADLSKPAPWYFRTLESWIDLFNRHHLDLHELREPLNPETHKPWSVIFIAERGE